MRRRGTKVRTAALLVTIAALMPGAARAVPAGLDATGTDVDTPWAAASPRGNLDTALDELVTAHRRGDTRALGSATSARIDTDGALARVAVSVAPGLARIVECAAESHGGRVDGSVGDLVIAHIPVGELVAFSMAPGVRAVFAPPRPETLEITSEGVSEMNTAMLASATADHRAFTGAGIRIGILDGGFAGYRSLLGGELPPAGRVRMWRSDLPAEIHEGTDHGTAVAEIIHDVAPGAHLYLAVVRDPVDIAEAVDWMLANGVQIINMSMGWWGWARIDGGGEINAPFDKAAKRGVTCVVSAGNYRRRHWHGDFDPGPEDDVRRFLHNWSTHNEENRFTLTSTRTVEAWLWWDDWDDPAAGQSKQDYNLQLVRLAGSSWVEVAQSRNRQSRAGDRPVETVFKELDPGTYAWRIWKANATRDDVDFDLFVVAGPQFEPGNYFQTNTYARSLLQPADNGTPGVITVAALGRAPQFEQEDYSSEGPTIDGRIGVDIAGPSDVFTVSNGTTRFAGTSASAPHIAGLAALIREAEAGVTGADVEAILAAQSLDLGAPGVDTRFGTGRVSLKPYLSMPVSATPRALAYNRSAMASARLARGATPLGGLDDVTIWRRHVGSTTWKRLGSAGWDGAAGAYTASVPFTANGWLQFRFPGTSQYAPRRSAAVTVTARALLSTPSVPKTVLKGKTFTVSGTLRPRHDGGTTVEIHRVIGTRTRLYRRVSARTVSLDGTTTKYRANLTVPTSGRWMVRAVHSDATHSKTLSGKRVFTVR